jgi:hypothetical protein
MTAAFRAARWVLYALLAASAGFGVFLGAVCILDALGVVSP